MWKGPKSKEAGFLMIELAFVLMVMGLVLGPGLSLFKAQRRAFQYRTTLEHQKLVFEALQQYFAQHGSLPCPGERWGSQRGQAHGRCYGAEAVGIVPYRDLGLSSYSAKDGHGHWMTYAVEPSLTYGGENVQEVLCRRLFDERAAFPFLDISEGETASVVQFFQNAEPKRRNSLAVVLISHGPQGYGAFGPEGKRLPFREPVSACKQANANEKFLGTARFCAAPDFADQKYLFDDIVRWMTKSQIVRGAHIACPDHFFTPSRKVP